MTIELERYTAIFTAMGEATRLQMVQMIDEAGEMACTSLVEKLGVAKSTVSYHVKILAHAKLISVRKQGRNYFYTTRRDVLDEAMPGLRAKLAGPASSGSEQGAVRSAVAHQLA
ncbi:MAG TPA: metalloregulator ArsR/SmtB family transcription factor [Rhizobiaceae bacterium]|nr:metalloregulator ArsR/SmtB family transcription factor [Rhizobiaceae bacterium]